MRAERWDGTGQDAANLVCDLPRGNDCDPQFLFCLREYATSGSDAQMCAFGSVETGEFDNGDAFSFGSLYIDEANNVPNPIAFSNPGNYPVSCLQKRMHDMYNT